MSTAPPVLAADLTAGLKRLKMAGMRRLAPELLVTAKTQRWNPEEFLRTLVEAEIAAREESNTRTRRRQAMFPVVKTLDEFDLTASSVPRATLDYLASLEWIRAAENVCLIGPAGTGKSHVLLALGSTAVDAGHRVRYVLASRLVNELAEADNDRTLSKVIARYGRVDLLCLDELGYLSLDRRGAELLFQVLTEREEKTAIAIASNEPFSGWTKTITDPRLCAAIVDRLTFNGQIIETGTTSYRLAHARNCRSRAPS